MVGLGEIFNKEISQVLMDIYWKALEPFSDEICAHAFNQVITTSKFFPKPAELLERISGSPEDRAMLAWLSVEDAIRRFGPYTSVRFVDPVIISVIESLGGWPSFENFTNNELKWKQKVFFVRYRAMQEKSEHSSYLPGIAEIENNSRGYSEFIEPPVTVPQIANGKVKILDVPKRTSK